MTKSEALTPEQWQFIDDLVVEYNNNVKFLRPFLNNVEEVISDSALAELIHFTRKRLKNPQNLRTKLARQLKRDLDQNKPFHISKENLLTEVNDLAAFRIIHLHTSQIEKIHPLLLAVFAEQNFKMVAPYPEANVWDKEAESYFENKMQIRCKVNPRMYVSVHYVIESTTQKAMTCEIQVRTLADELWGEVDHMLNYPLPHSSFACREQISVLARLSSSASRLVDAIMATDAEYQIHKLPEELRSEAGAVDEL